MRLLLDTHAFVWALEDNRRLGRVARRRMQDADVVCVSAASIFEIAVKTVVGKLRMRLGPGQSLATLIHEAGFDELPVRSSHAAMVAELPLVHGDPFDQLLVAQARVEGLTVVTADEAFAAYGIPVLDAST